MRSSAVRRGRTRCLCRGYYLDFEAWNFSATLLRPGGARSKVLRSDALTEYDRGLCACVGELRYLLVPVSPLLLPKVVTGHPNRLVGY